MTSCIKLIAQIVPHDKREGAKTAEYADFLSFRKAGTPLANWLNCDQWSLVAPCEKGSATRGLRK
jgi:hypothetical protein